MKNNLEPEEERYGWNSSKEAVPGLTCKEAASVLTQFSSAFRALIMIDRAVGFQDALAQVSRMIDAQIRMVRDQGINGPKKDDILEKTALTMGMALISIGAQDPSTIGLLASQGVGSLIDIQKKIGEEKFDNSIVRFNVRRVEAKDPKDHHGLEIGCETLPMEEVAKKMEKLAESSIVKEAAKIVSSVLEEGSKKVDPSNN